MSNLSREMADLVKQARRQGCSVEQQKRSNHYKIKVPNGGIVVCAATPSDQRAVLNMRARLRREGLNL